MGGLVGMIGCATLLLTLAVWPYGTSVSQDSSFFWRAATNLHQGNGIGWTFYVPASDALVFRPLTHHPPLLMVLYSVLMYLPIDPVRMTAVLSMIGWPLFLLGIGALTYRLSRSQAASLLAVLCAALTPSFWYVFTSAFVEVVFLPLLVWYMVFLVDSASQPADWQRKLMPAGILLALLLLTRYTGVLVLGASVLWWAWWLLQYRSVRYLINGGILFGLASVPLALWLLRNALISQKPLSNHLIPFGGFLEGLTAFASETFRMLIPVLDIDNLRATLSPPGLLVLFALYGLSFILGLVIFWRHLPRPWSVWLHPHRSPIMLFSLFYILLYTLIQPFLNFWPIDLRDMTTLHSMVLPYAFGTLAHLSGRAALLPLGAYSTLTVALMASPVVVQGWPDWIRPAPPYIVDIGNRDSDLVEAPDFKTSGVISLVRPNPVRTSNLRRHFSELAARIEAEEDVVVVTNDLRLFTISDLRALEPLTVWRDGGQCQSRQTVLIVAIDWTNVMNFTQDKVPPLVETRCPTLSAQSYDQGKALVYELAPRP
jgi:hypothetical protein